MKKIFTGLMLLSIVYVHAQENKNKFVVNANVGVSYSNPNSLRLGNFNVGYFFTDQFSVGFTGNYSNAVSKTSHENNINLYSNSMKNQWLENYAGVFARYNFIPKNKFSFFLSLDNRFTWNKSTYEISSLNNGVLFTESRTQYTKGYQIALNPGIMYFFHPKFSTEISLGSIYYSAQKIDSDEPSLNRTSTHSAFTSTLFTSGFSVGFSYYFACKHKNSEQ